MSFGLESEDVEIQSERLIDLIDAHQLQPVDISKRQYISFIKSYMKRVKQHLLTTDPTRAEIFMIGAQVNFLLVVPFNRKGGCGSSVALVTIGFL